MAIKVDGKVEYLIEAKAVGLELKESHLRQAVDYGANNGVQWVILTNGIVWRVYKIRFEQPINYDLVCSFNLADLDPRNEDHREKLFIFCKEGLVKEAREEFHQKILTVNRFILGSLILSDDVVNLLRRELRKLSDGVLVTPREITKVLANEVLKREVIDGEEACKAQSRVRRFYSRGARRTRRTDAKEPAAEEAKDCRPEASFSDTSLANAKDDTQERADAKRAAKEKQQFPDASR